MLLSSHLSALLSVGFFVVVVGSGGGVCPQSLDAFWHLTPLPLHLGVLLHVYVTTGTCCETLAKMVIASEMCEAFFLAK